MVPTIPPLLLLVFQFFFNFSFLKAQPRPKRQILQYKKTEKANLESEPRPEIPPLYQPQR